MCIFEEHRIPLAHLFIGLVIARIISRVTLFRKLYVLQWMLNAHSIPWCKSTVESGSFDHDFKMILFLGGVSKEAFKQSVNVPPIVVDVVVPVAKFWADRSIRLLSVRVYTKRKRKPQPLTQDSPS